jgi:hypothetical protein
MKKNKMELGNAPVSQQNVNKYIASISIPLFMLVVIIVYFIYSGFCMALGIPFN